MFFVKKPPAFTAKDVLEICDKEEESKKVLMYGFNHRHHDSIKKIKDLIKNKKEFGKSFMDARKIWENSYY